MKSQKDGFGYNERLFSGGLRGWFHGARFYWVIQQISKHKCSTSSVLELGCFDGKLIDYLPALPSRYVGYDANWEGGLDLAKIKYGSNPCFEFIMARSAGDINLVKMDKFDLAVSMETLEHIDDDDTILGYLDLISRHLDGYFLITVPNEKGLIFATKYLAKKLLSKDAEKFTLSEFINATIGRMDRVPRLQHKGFDYNRLIDMVEKYFRVVEISGHPFSLLPYSLCFGVGIVARSRTRFP
jgi:SAM-dependent methyltransferase